MILHLLFIKLLHHLLNTNYLIKNLLQMYNNALNQIQIPLNKKYNEI